jgi:hypothetical protein
MAIYCVFGKVKNEWKPEDGEKSKTTTNRNQGEVYKAKE